jgi:hypothetical protein
MGCSGPTKLTLAAHSLTREQTGRQRKVTWSVRDSNMLTREPLTIEPLTREKGLVDQSTLRTLDGMYMADSSYLDTRASRSTQFGIHLLNCYLITYPYQPS